MAAGLLGSEVVFGWCRDPLPNRRLLGIRIAPRFEACSIGDMTLVTRILDATHRGETAAAEELLPLVYDELRRLAAAKMSHEAPGHTLQPTALVHEAWLRVVGPDGKAQFHNRGHFFGAA